MLNIWKRFWKGKQQDKAALKREEIEFLPAALEVEKMPPSSLGRLVLWMLFVLLLASIAWSFLGHVDEIAVANGKIIPNGEVKLLQAEDKGVVKAIYVKDGQLVKKGDVLIELDTTMTAADLNTVQHRLVYYQLDRERLLAEQSGSAFTPEQQPGGDEKDALYEIQLYQSRQAEYERRMAAAQSNVMQMEAGLAGAQTGCEKLENLYALAQEKASRMELLASEDAVSTFTVLDYQAKCVELGKDIETQRSELEKAQWALMQARQQMDSITAEHTKEITAALVEDQKQLAAAQEELKKAEEKTRLATIVAPMDGRISQLSVHTGGGIVTPAQTLMEVVPEDVPLQVEAWVQNKDIGFIQNGQPAEIKVETFSFQKFGTLQGRIADISPDAVEDKDKGRLYKVLVDIDKNTYQMDGKEAALTSGMTATAEIKVRQKRIIEFFMDPFRQYQSEALRER